MEGLVGQPFLGTFPLGDVAVHDDQSNRLALRAPNGASGGLKKAPGTVFVSDAVFEPFSPAGVASLRRSLQHTRAIVWMNLIHGRSCCQFFRTISKDFLICGTVIEALSLAVDHGNHVRGIFRNQLKKVFALGQLATDSLQLSLLVDGVDVE